MQLKIIKSLILGIGAVLCVASAGAADTDIFESSNINGVNAPYLLFVMDTGASFGANNDTFRCNINPMTGEVKTDGTGTAANFTALDKSNGGVEQCAMYSVIKAVADAGTSVNIGVMFFNANQAILNPSNGTFMSQNCIGSGGGCLALAPTMLNASTSTNILEWVRKWTISGNSNYNIKSPANRGDGATMQEAWAQYFGKTGISGQSYNSLPSVCGNKFIVFMGNAYNTQASPKDTTNDALSPKKAFEGSSVVLSSKRANPLPTDDEKDSITDSYAKMICGASTPSGTVPSDEGNGAYALNWAKYLKNQGVVTYSVGITGDSCDTTYVAQLTKMGSLEVGGGNYFSANTYEELVKALTTVVSEVQAVNSAFASAALPASVNTQGLYLNQVFIGMFRPGANSLPRWNGNLKQYKMAVSGNDLELQDADSKNAINNLTGFITECARSFWTPSDLDTYWSGAPSGDCAAAGAKVSNSPDGKAVEKGAQAYQLRLITPANRKVWTCGTTMATCTNTLTEFKTTAMTSVPYSLFGAVSDMVKNELINWARGLNVDDDLNKGTTVMRPSVHGDVVHSRPVAVNHGTDDAASVVVYYGGNDGLLRAINGNRTSSITSPAGSTLSYAAGQELWSFMPPEFYANITRLRTNTETVYTPVNTSGTAKKYGMDGPITALQGTISGNANQTYIFATMRRGGRAVYAFNVTTPGSPQLKWKTGCYGLTSDGDCTVSNPANTEYAKFGQTWSTPKTFYATGYESGTSPLLVMGGGYDNCEDYDANSSGGKNHSCVSGGGTSEGVTVTKGNRVFILNAANGTIVASFKTKRAVIADVAIVKDANGKAKYGYTADLGGWVYRIDLTGGTVASWSITPIASLGCDTPSACTDSVANRKFMFAPSVLSVGGKYQLLFGSGDREKPVKQYISSKSVANHFFKITDNPADAGWLTTSTVTTTCGGSYICKALLYGITTSATPTQTQLDTKPMGWYLGLSSTEQVVTQSITIFGVTTFSTHQPAIGSGTTCNIDLGTTLLYNVSYANAAGVAIDNSRSADLSGDGLPPSPLGGLVKLDDNTIEAFCMGCSANSPEAPKRPRSFSTVSKPKSRLYWYIEK